MKVVVFFIYVFFLLLIRGISNYADTHCVNNKYTSSHKLKENKHVKFTNNNQSVIFIDDNDFDLEEEYQCNEDFKDASFAEKQNLLNSRYHSNFRTLVLNNHCNDFKTVPFIYVNSSPIYISNNTLRI